jgi:radical SAM protein with 4Fe4S-binding SPASM domain
METREMLRQAVESNPGITFTELKEETGLATGTVQYHLKKSDEMIQKNSAVLMKGQCADCDFNSYCSDRCLQSMLRDEIKQKIIKGLSEGKKKGDIAEEIDLHPSTVSYHVSCLRENDLLDADDNPVSKARKKVTG